MSKLIAVVGESGSGKSTSIENLNPNETFIINVVGKDLPFKGSRKKYNRDQQKNYIEEHSSAKIVEILKKISSKRPDIKNVIIDDFQYVMATEFINRALEKGYDKWSEMAQQTFSIVNPDLHNNKLREDLNVVVLTHLEEVEKNYQTKKKIKTSGKLIDQHLTLEGLFTIVLFTEMVENDEGVMTYNFRTQTDGLSTAKSPKGMFDSVLIPNDLALVIDKIKDYYEG